MLTALRARHAIAVALSRLSPGGSPDFMDNSSSSFIDNRKKDSKKNKGSFLSRVGGGKVWPLSLLGCFRLASRVQGGGERFSSCWTELNSNTRRVGSGGKESGK